MTKCRTPAPSYQEIHAQEVDDSSGDPTTAQAEYQPEHTYTTDMMKNRPSRDTPTRGKL